MSLLSQKNSMEYYWIILLLPAFFGSSHGYCGAPPRLDFGELDPQFFDQNNFSVGANVTYNCRLGYIPVRGVKNVLTCLSDSTWSTPETFCTRRSCGNPGNIENGEVSFTDTLFGSRANFTCNYGYNMISRRNYRLCQADGTWSNTVPICEVQKCPPPNAITDGTFHPDKEEYEYQDAVSYECNDKSLSLIGDTTLSCTANGNWSSDPPQCKAVACSSPNVENSRKLSGFSGPYTLNSAVTFECLPGYTMVGESVVKCSVNNEWEPRLPTCNRIVTQRPTTTKEKETETGGSTVTTETTTTMKDKENGGGNNVGVVVGNTLIIFAMSVMAFLINNGF